MIDIHPEIKVAFGLLADFTVPAGDPKGYLATRAAVAAVEAGRAVVTVQPKDFAVAVAMTLPEAEALGLPEVPAKWYPPGSQAEKRAAGNPLRPFL